MSVHCSGVGEMLKRLEGMGNSNIRNPILVSFIAKGLLPYHGLGSGIKRALDEWPDIDFMDDHEGCLFTVTVHRKAVKSSGKTRDQILLLLSDKPEITIPEISEKIGVSTRSIDKQIARLRIDGRIRRVGSKKAGTGKF
jgi:ATP-dependent DNA helicase RecG